MALVSYVLGECPGCGAKNSFGNVSVRERQVLQGCKSCRFQATLWLPDIRKKVLYLDQCFFSRSFREDPRFSEAIERVKRMAHLQLLLVPYSSIHEDETFQWRGYKEFTHADLLAFIKATARGAEFKKDYFVERTQVTKAWRAFLEGKPAEYAFEDSDSIEGPVDEWDDYFRIDVGGYHKDVELKRSLKAQAVDELVRIFDEWQASKQTFEQDVAVEMHAAASNFLDTYVAMTDRLSRGDFAAIIDSPIVSKVVEHMLHWLPDEQLVDDKLRRCVEFFKSEHFNQVPSLWIEARMFATLKAMVKRGSFANREVARRDFSGVFEDIKHIALYAPYCDAFFMDKQMAEIVRQPTVDLTHRFGVEVFSLTNLGDFVAWLDGLEQNASDEHMAGVRMAYPERTDIP